MKLLLPLSLLLAGAVGATVLSQSDDPAAQDARASRADLLPPAHARKVLATGASTVSKGGGVSASAAPTPEEVGDVDSFERNVRWLGVTQAFITLTDDCTGSTPEDNCQVLAPAPATTSFSYPDIARITLPGKAANSLLCYWFSPVLNVGWGNAGATQVIGRLVYNPTLTLENEVLDDPALIDPTTGAPFGGKLLTGMTSSERLEVPLPPATFFSERQRDSAVCIAGFISRRALVDNYGLTAAQAKEFFKKPTTVRLNVTGNARHVQFAQLVFGLRIVGD